MNSVSLRRALPLLVFLLFPVIAPVAAAESDSRPLVAIWDLEPRNTTASDAIVVSDELRTALVASNKFRIFEKTKMDALTTALGVNRESCISTDCAVDAGQKIGANYMIVVSLGVAGSQTVLNTRFFHVTTGQILFSESIMTDGGVDSILLTGIATIAEKITNDYAQMTSSAEQEADDSLVTTPPVTADVDTVTPAVSVPVEVAVIKDDTTVTAMKTPVVSVVTTPKPLPNTPIPETLKKRESNKFPVVAIIGGGLLVCGGIAAVILLNAPPQKSGSNSEQVTLNVDLPE